MKELKLGNGVRITESDDMGIFIHFESKTGNQTGQFLGNTDDTPGHRWAVELLKYENDVYTADEDSSQETPLAVQ